MASSVAGFVASVVVGLAIGIEACVSQIAFCVADVVVPCIAPGAAVVT